jgi:hypothetical protein
MRIEWQRMAESQAQKHGLINTAAIAKRCIQIKIIGHVIDYRFGQRWISRKTERKNCACCVRDNQDDLPGEKGVMGTGGNWEFDLKMPEVL